MTRSNLNSAPPEHAVTCRRLRSGEPGVPAGVCGHGVERRLCVLGDVGAGRRGHLPRAARHTPLAVPGFSLGGHWTALTGHVLVSCCARVFVGRLVSLLNSRLVGLVVKASTSRAEDPGFDSRLRRGEFSGSSHTSVLKIGNPVATLPGTWCYKVSAGTDLPGVGIL